MFQENEGKENIICPSEAPRSRGQHEPDSCVMYRTSHITVQKKDDPDKSFKFEFNSISDPDFQPTVAIGKTTDQTFNNVIDNFPNCTDGKITQFEFNFEDDDETYMIAWSKCNENNKPSTDINANKELDDPINNTGCS